MPTPPSSSPVFWRPTDTHIATSALTAFTNYINQTHNANITIGDYTSLHKWTIQNTQAFWSSVIHFTNFITHPPQPPLPTILQPGPQRSTLPSLVNVVWLRNTLLNFSETILQHHNLTPHKPAIIYRPESATNDARRKTLTFRHLHARVAALTTALRNAAVRPGDAVAAVLPNTPDAVVAMLAVAAAGAVWSCCAPDFGRSAISSRLVQTAPIVLFYSPCYQYKSRRHDICPTISAVVRTLPTLRLLVRVPPAFAADDAAAPSLPPAVRHVALRDFERMPTPAQFEYQLVPMAHPVVTMFSSGTTGRPKCIVQGAGILLNQMKEHRLHLEISERSVVFFSTSTGWMLFNWLLAVLASGSTIILYDGAAMPEQDTARLVTISCQEGVTHFGSGAKYFQALQGTLSPRSLPRLRKHIPSLRMVLATGSPSTIEHFAFARDYFGADVQYVSMSGGTEINGCFALGTPWKPVVAPELQCAGLGMDVCVFDQKGEEVEGQSGELVCRNVCPCMPVCFGHDDNDERYRESYFSTFGENVWSHGDFAEKSASGGIQITGRSDSTLNPGGVRIGTSDLYEVIETLDFIADSIVAEQSWGSDVRVIMFVVLSEGSSLEEKKEKEIRAVIRERLSPRHMPSFIVEVSDIPYTFSGKKCEIPIKKLLNGLRIDNRDAVKNPASFDAIQRALRRKGLLAEDERRHARFAVSRM